MSHLACPLSSGDLRQHALPATASGMRPRSTPDDEEDMSISTQGHQLPWSNFRRPRNYSRPRSVQDYWLLADATSAQPPFQLGRASEPWPRLRQPAAVVPAGCERSFTVGSRGDMRGVMRPLFERLGLCEPRPTAGSVHVLWIAPIERETKFHFAPWGDAFYPAGAIINSVPGLPQLLGVKPALARLHVRCLRRMGLGPLDSPSRAGERCQFTRRAFAVGKGRLEGVYRQFRRFNLETAGEQTGTDDPSRPAPHRIWISKPKRGYNAVGIHVHSLPAAALETDAATLAWLTQRIPEGEFVLQDYVMNPMLFRGHKFDVRVWAVVLSIDPLRVHMLGTGIPKVSMFKFSNEPAFTKNPCMHYLMPGSADCFYTRKDPQRMRQLLLPKRGEYPTSTTNAYWFDNITPKGEEFWRTVAWRSLERALVEVLLLAREQMIHVDHAIKARGARYKRIFFLSPDLVLDQRGRAYLVEINTNGYMIGNLHKEFFPLKKEQAAVGSFTGASGFPLQHHYRDDLAAATTSFCQRTFPPRGCPPSVELELREMVHEQIHSSRQWYRLFPRSSTSHVYRTFADSPQFAECLTPLDKLFAQWLAQGGWLPVHTVNATTGVFSINGQKAVYENRRRKGLGLTHGDDTTKHDHWNV